MSFEPTHEQKTAIALFSEQVGLAIEAGAGSGKTSTLQLMSEATSRRGQYVAFNRAIVDEAQRRMPSNVAASTMHSLAFRTKGAAFRPRLNAGRVPSTTLARMLKLDPIVVTYDDKPKVVQPGTLGSLVMRAITAFCQSADPEPTAFHIPYIKGIDEADDNGRRTFENNREVARALEPKLVEAWRDLTDPKGRLPYKHDHYLKAWELDGPQIAAEFILFDEAQDAAPVMESIVFQQTDAQLVVVGDSQQAIYGWRGAVDALANFKAQGEAYATLTQSFRFGPAIADVANLILNRLDAELRLTGTPTIDSRLAVLADADVDAVLCRSNARAVTTLLQFQQAGRKVHLMGGGGEILQFARAAQDLKEGRGTGHPELACFDSWLQVQEYVEADPQGDELKLLVGLVDDFGTDTIIRALDKMPREDDPNAIVVSTSHKAKGREWNNVRLSSDYRDPGEERDEEWKLLYVAATRAKRVLDVSQCAPLQDLINPQAIAAPLPGVAI